MTDADDVATFRKRRVLFLSSGKKRLVLTGVAPKQDFRHVFSCTKMIDVGAQRESDRKEVHDFSGMPPKT